MQIISKLSGLILLFLLPCHFAFAFVIPAAVPFASIILPPGNSINASYAFNNSAGNFSMIWCFENTFQIDPPAALMQWTFQGQLFPPSINEALPLSQTPLVINSNFQGFPADPVGSIIIHNSSGIPLVVSCQFGY